MIVTSHIQIAYYTLLAAGLYLVMGVIQSVREKASVQGTLLRLGSWVTGFGFGMAASSLITIPVRGVRPLLHSGGHQWGA